MFRPNVYSRLDVATRVCEKLSDGKRKSLPILIQEITQQLELPVGVVAPGLYHMLWHGKLEIDFHSLIFLDGAPLPKALVWLPVKEVSS
jgi:hypothetical protein